jgi:hypothetical protein
VVGYETRTVGGSTREGETDPVPARRRGILRNVPQNDPETAKNLDFLAIAGIVLHGLAGYNHMQETAGIPWFSAK